MKTPFKYLLVLTLTSFVFAGCATQHSESKHGQPGEGDQSAQWEYRTELLRQDGNGTAARLNELNSEGWILVSVTQPNYSNGQAGNSFSTYTFKHLKQ